MSHPEQSNQEKRNDNSAENGTEKSSGKKPNMLQVIGSVLAAGFGVQSSKNRQRDFNQGNFIVYVIAGLIFTALFIFTLYTIVSVILAK